MHSGVSAGSVSPSTALSSPPQQVARLQVTPVQSRKASGSFSTASSSAASNNSFSATPTQRPLQVKHANQLLSDFPFEISSKQRIPTSIEDNSSGGDPEKNSSSCKTAFKQIQENQWNLNSENSIGDDFDSESPSSYPRSSCSSPGKRATLRSGSGNQQSPLLNCQVIHRLEIPKVKLKLPLLAKPLSDALHPAVPVFQKRNSEEKNADHLQNHYPLNQQLLFNSPQYQNHQPQTSMNESKNCQFKKGLKGNQQNTASPRPSITPGARNNSRLTTPRGSANSNQLAPYVTPFSMKNVANSPQDSIQSRKQSNGQGQLNTERILLFIRLKFQQIDVVQSSILSKQEILDFFDGKTIANSYIELPGFREEEAILREYASLFMRNIFTAVTERSGLVNVREFKNLMQPIFNNYESLDSGYASPVRTFGDVLNLYQVESRSETKKPTTSEQVKTKRRQLKSAYIQRDSKGGIDEKAIRYTQLDEINPNELKLIHRKPFEKHEKNSEVYSHFQAEVLPGKSQSPPRIRAVVPRLRSFSIRGDEKFNRAPIIPTFPQSSKQQPSTSATTTPSNAIRKADFIGKTQNKYSQSKQPGSINVQTSPVIECQSEPVLEFKADCDEETEESQKAVTSTALDLFECTFQPHNFKEQQVHLFSQNLISPSNSSTNETDETPFLQTFNFNFRSNSYEAPRSSDALAVIGQAENMTQSEGQPKRIEDEEKKNNKIQFSMKKGEQKIPFLQLGLGGSPGHSMKGNNPFEEQPTTISPSKFGGNAVDAIDQNCSNFLLKKEVKVFKRHGLKKRQTLNEQALSNRVELPTFEAPIRQELVRKLEKLFLCETNNNSKPVISMVGYDVPQ